jgi:hypothetical protein
MTSASLRKYSAAALAGGIASAAVAFVYFNVNDLECMAADAAGFPAWSYYDLPFVVPWAVAGAAMACGLVWAWDKLCQARDVWRRE